MYFLTVGAMFKNESHSIVEWLEHYLQEGVEHFYLIDDNSTDNSVVKLESYIRQGIITLFQSDAGEFLGRQRYLYNIHLLPRLHETTWMWILDLDEYVWSPAYPTLAELMRNVQNCGQLQVNHTLFGSNGHDKQPTSVVAGFTRRSATQPTNEKINLKYAVNSAYEFTSLNVHHATFKCPEHNEYPHFTQLGPEYLIMNHYSCQSRDFWKNTKMIRGDSDHYMTRSWGHFNETDLNDVVDFRLADRRNQRK